MRTLAAVTLQAALAAVLAGCAYPSAGPGGAGGEPDRLQSQCRDRGGILVPSGANTGRPSLDNVCRID